MNMYVMKNTYTAILIVTAAISCLFSAGSLAMAQKPDRSRNFIMETVIRKAGMTDTASVNTLAATDATRTITYYDGLGFPVQTISLGAVAEGYHDLVLHREYDQYMRESRVWLPYADMEASSAGFRTNAGEATAEFYSSGTVPGMKPDNAPYAVTVYESSPLGRILVQGAPGEVWQPAQIGSQSTRRTTVFTYGTCTRGEKDDVLIWETTDNGIYSPGKYAPGSLSRLTRHGPDNCMIETYTDLDGRTVMERRWTMAEAGYGNEYRPYDTYFIYDGLGRLRHVLPPLLTDALTGRTSASENDPDMKALAYSYRYNGHGDCVWKKLPGAEPVEMLYDSAHRMVLSRDGNQSERGVWSFCFYDGLGRPAVSGEAALPYPEDISDSIFSATYTGTGNTGGYELSISLPQDAVIHRISYYDSYHFISILPETIQDSLKAREWSRQVYTATDRFDRYGSGRLTGSAVRTLGDEQDRGTDSPQPMYSAFYYDDKGRTVQTRAMNHIGGWDTEATEYSFTGMPLKRIQHHSDTDSSFAETSTYSFDNMDRPLTVAHQLDEDEPVTVSDLSYDLLGRVASEKRNGNPELATAFSYNIRSWLKTSEGDILSMRFYHEDTREGALSNTQRFDGGISALDWSVRGGHAGGYNFSYDGFTRLTEAEYISTDPDGENFSTAYSYDANGNILSLTRYGTEGNPSRPVEALSMEYDGNRLSAVTDSGTARNRALRRKTARQSTSQEDFTYDANGNLTSDLTAGIAAVSYNLLNLPQSFSIVTEDGSAETRYLYDADGRKLRVTATGSDGAISVTDYTANVVRTDGKVDRILFEGGYIHNGKYHFFFSDHLGSVRAVACEDGSVIQSSAYYPFGETFGDSPDTCPSSQPYKFNGKEDQSFASVPLLDYGARLLSTRTGRWTTMDPLAEKYYSISPYAYCGNNPVNLIDPDGMWIFIYYNNQSYKYENGKLYQYQTSGEKATSYIEITPEEGSFVEGIFNALNDLGNNTNTGKELLNYFSNNDKDAYIHPYSKIADNNETNKQENGLVLSGISAPIYMKDDLSGTAIPTENGIEESPLWLDLGHELSHRKDYITNGEKVNEPWITIGDEIFVKSEIQATHYENLMRQEAGLPLRTHYGTIKENDVVIGPYFPSRLIRKNGKSIVIPGVQYTPLKKRK